MQRLEIREERLASHARGSASKHIMARLPVTLVYSEEAFIWSQTARREAEIKKMSRCSKLALFCHSESP